MSCTAQVFIPLVIDYPNLAGDGTIVPTLGTLALFGAIQNGAPSSGSIFGSTVGSTIASNVAGLTVNSVARTYTWDGTGVAGSTANGLVETLAGATNTPKSSSVTVTAGAVTLATLTPSTGFQIGTAVTGSLTGKTTGSTIASNIPGIIVTGSTYSGTPTGSAATIANAFVETLAGAVGSPKPSPATVIAAGVTSSLDFSLASNSANLALIAA